MVILEGLWHYAWSNAATKFTLAQEIQKGVQSKFSFPLLLNSKHGRNPKIWYEYVLWAKRSSPFVYWVLNKVCFGVNFFGPNLFGVRLFRQKSSFSEKATKIWKILPLALMLLSKNSCFVKMGGRFFQIVALSKYFNFLYLIDIFKLFIDLWWRE